MSVPSYAARRDRSDLGPRPERPRSQRTFDEVYGQDYGQPFGTMKPVTLIEVMSKRSKILELAHARRAKRVRIFGSVVRGDAGPTSDVDFLVDFEPEA